MSGDENLDIARGERLRLIIVVTNLMRRLHTAKLGSLLNPKRIFLAARPLPREL